MSVYVYICIQCICVPAYICVYDQILRPSPYLTASAYLSFHGNQGGSRTQSMNCSYNYHNGKARGENGSEIY